MKDYDWTEEKKTYHIRVRITYEDIVDIEAHDLRSASIEAEKYVFANMNGGDDPIEPTIDIQDWRAEVYYKEGLLRQKYKPRCFVCKRTDVDERSWQEQDGRTLCPQCVGLYTDEELNDRLTNKVYD